MAPLRGWAQRGRRLKGHAPHGHWRTMTFLAAPRTDGIGAPCVFDGPINTRCLQAWGNQELVSTLRPGDTPSSSTISQATRARRSARRSTAPVPAFGSCRPTHPISIRSSRPSPRSSAGCETRRSATLRTPGAISATSSPPSSQANAKTTSKTSDMVPQRMCSRVPMKRPKGWTASATALPVDGRRYSGRRKRFPGSPG